ncbi:hypothetical protein Tsubulata_020459 [Turnera subulata]|uniref:Branched-chain-amino-acid aminotransferase n=1 Tax=Turnera subulata TaxID=218843 RepID=A0A9Q0JP01_9ROSI|nr:hypothetical protein Tsubulata_020459 [Turnera subulata]
MAPSSIQSPAATQPDSDGGEKYAKVNWDELDFSLTCTDYMYVARFSAEDKFSPGNITPYRNIELSPAAAVLHYGQGLFEGLKAYRREDGRIMLFRPDQNALRMQMGAERMFMPAPSTEQFVDAVKQTVLANKRWVPPHGKGSLYVRPMLFGTGAILGLGPAPECTFLVFTSPTGHYYKGSEKAVNLCIEKKFHRATPGGTGGIKSITNYSPVFEALKGAKAKGFDDIILLDAATGKYIEEIASCNIFILKGDTLSTPETLGTILPGITRKSIIELAKELNYKVEERLIPVEDVLAADEVFCTGTAVVVTPVGSITYEGKRTEYRTGEGAVSHKLRAMLTGIQTGLLMDSKGWTVLID